MGGERETTVEGKKSTESVEVNLQPDASQKLRIHEKDGYVHFHDDKNNLKAAIRSYEWWKAWDELKKPGSELSPWTYCDSENNAALTVSVEHKNNETGPGIVATVDLFLEPFQSDDTFKKLNNFSVGRR